MLGVGQSSLSAGLLVFCYLVYFKYYSLKCNPMKKFLSCLSIVIALSSCSKDVDCEVVGRWQIDGFDNTLYEFTDSLRYTIYSTTPNTFGTIADAIPNPKSWRMDGDTLEVDLNFGSYLRAYPVFDCDCNVLDLITDMGTTTLHKEGFDISTCR